MHPIERKACWTILVGAGSFKLYSLIAILGPAGTKFGILLDLAVIIVIIDILLSMRHDGRK